MEYIHQIIVVDGEATTQFNKKHTRQTTVYEVLRVLDGIPVFLEKHLLRLNNSAKLIKKTVPFSGIEFKELIDMLINENKVFNGNIKISILYGANNTIHSILGFIPHKYPSEQEYLNGVKTVSSKNLRNNPNAKIQNDTLREEINKLIQLENAYEAVLVHPEGYITEGSRSNIFFILGNKIVTAPDNLVLSGITRENVIDLCRKNNFDIEFSPLYYSDLANADAAFITGTSPKVLPIRSIDQYSYTLPHPTINVLLEQYNELIQSYVDSYKRTRSK